MSDIRSLFRELAGRAPDLVASAPGRVNLIGEHTDYNLGFAMPFAIDRRTSVALGARDDRTVTVRSTFSDEHASLDLDDLRADAPPSIEGWPAYALGVVWALARAGSDLSAVPGVDLVIASDVPVGAGLSSSAAIECSVGFALDRYWNLGLDRPALAAVGQRAENDVVGAPTGIMDQSASMLGRRDSAVFLDCRSLDTEIVGLGLEPAGLVILVIDTKVAHEHASGGYRERRASCEAGARALGVASLRELGVDDLPRAERELDDVTFRRVRHVVTEDQRVLDTVRTLRDDGPEAIGPLLDASHASMRNDFEISVPELDLAVETARDAGALGARMTGGGFGGAAIALTPRSAIDAVTERVLSAFRDRGYREPDIFAVAPSDGAGEDDR